MPNKGYKQTIEHKQKEREAHKKYNTKTCKCMCCRSVRGELPSWNTGLTKETNKSLLIVSNKLTGREVSVETRKKQSEQRKGRVVSNEWKQHLSDSWTNERRKQKGEELKRLSTECWKDLEYRKRMSNIRKELWKDEAYRGKMSHNLFGMRSKRPTILEQSFIDFFNTHNLPFKYVGNGVLRIGGLFPDFVETNGRKIVLETANKAEKDFRRGNWKEYEKNRIKHFEKNGWKCLVLWDEKLKDEKQLFDNIKEILK